MVSSLTGISCWVKNSVSMTGQVCLLSLNRKKYRKMNQKKMCVLHVCNMENKKNVDRFNRNQTAFFSYLIK